MSQYTVLVLLGRDEGTGGVVSQVGSFFVSFTTVLSHWDFSHVNRGCFSPEERQLQQELCCPTQPSVHAGYFARKR